VREVFQHGETVWLTPAGDGARLGAALAELARDDACRHALGRNARALMVERFDRARQGERLRRILADRLGERNGGPRG
jgi:glycosyltransferase involved in cell wall biosynthesis